MKTLAPLVFLAALLAPAAPALAATRVSLLADHLSAEVPDAATLAASAQADQVKLEVPPGEMFPVFSMSTTERFMLSTGDVREDARRLLEPSRADGETQFGKGKGGVVFAWVRGKRPADFVHALVVHPDHSVQEVTFFLAEARSNERATYEAAALGILRSLTPGARRMDGHATTLRWADTFSFDVPEGYAAVVDGTRADPATFLTIHALVAVGEPSPGAILFTLNPKGGVQLPGAPGSTLTKGTLLGQPVYWARAAQGADRSSRAYLKVDEGLLGVLVLSHDLDVERGMMTMAETLHR